MVANGFLNLLFIDINNIKDTQVVSKWDNIYKSTSLILNIEVSFNDKWIYVSLKPKGLAIIDIQDIKNPK